MNNINTIIYQQHTIKEPSKLFWFNDNDLHKGQCFAHHHIGIEFLFCNEGSGRIICEKNIIELNKNDTAIINSNAIHELDFNKNSSVYCLIIFKQFFDNYGIDLDSLHFKNRTSSPIAAELIKKVHEAYYNSTGNFSTAKKVQAISNYLIYMCQTFSNDNLQELSSDSKPHKATLNALSYINNNFKKKIAIEEIAKNVCYSKYHFSKIFKDNTGITISEYINKVRLEYARSLIQETDSLTTSIYKECGFTSYSFFVKCFKDEYGLLPKEYRKKVRTEKTTTKIKGV